MVKHNQKKSLSKPADSQVKESQEELQLKKRIKELEVPLRKKYKHR